MSSTIAESLPHGPIRQEIRNAQCFQIDNIARYMISESEEEYDSLMEQIPCIKLPFPKCWVEYGFPDIMRTKKHGVTPIHKDLRGARMGMLMYDGSKESMRKEDVLRACEGRGTPEALEAVRCSLVSDQHVVSIATKAYMMKADGRVLEQEYQRGVLVGAETYRYAGMIVLPPVPGSEVFPFFETVMFWAIGMMHCKNVRVEEASSTRRDAGSRKDRRARFKFHVLKVEVPGATRSSGGSCGGGKGCFSSHICRGHFKDFREKGLFGRYKGVYWWSPHVRGDERFGTVEKEYDVNVSDD